MTDQKIALVSGGNRGIGKEICRQLAQKEIRVLMGSRDPAQGEQAAAELTQAGLPVEVIALDVSDASSIAQAIAHIQEKYGRLDILVNNAGVFLDNDTSHHGSVLQIQPQTLQDTFLTNVYGPLQLMQACVPLMQAQNDGRIVNLSSGMGQLANMGGSSTAYRVSKTALNALTRIVHAELNTPHIKVNAMCPGWVKTDMGGPNATRDVRQGADTAVWLATLAPDGPSGKFFRDRQVLEW